MTKTEAFQYANLFLSLTTKNGYKAGKLYSIKPTDGTGDFIWSRSSAADRIDQDGNTESMGVNVPRVDYTNTCPELLIEDGGTWKDIAYNTTMDYLTSGQGTIFVRCRVQDSVSPKVDVIATINDGSDEAYITMYTDEDNNLTISTYNNPDQNDYTYALGANVIYNIAVGYDLFLGKINIAVNGVLKRANATTTNAMPVGVTRMDLGAIYNGISTQIDNRIIGLMWFDSQLSDTDIVNITA